MTAVKVRAFLFGVACSIIAAAYAGTAYQVFQPGGDLTGTWNTQTIATAAINLAGGKVTGTLPETSGGTNQSTYTQGDVLYASASNTLAKLAKNTTATRYLSNTGTSNAPAWAQVSLATGVTGALPATSVSAVPNWTSNSQATAYTVVLADAGKQVLHPNADTTARAYTIPQNSSVAFVIGTTIMIANDSGAAGADTIVQGTGTTLVLGGAGATTGTRNLAVGGVAIVTKTGTNRWIVWGSGVT